MPVVKITSSSDNADIIEALGEVTVENVELIAGVAPQMDDTNKLAISVNIVTEITWTTLINNIRIDDDPTAYYSNGMDVTAWSAVWVLIDIDSTLAPTHLRILAQWSYDSGATWWDFEEGLWASLGWEDTDTAARINKAYLLPCGGIDLIRIGAIGTGTDATNFFDVTVRARQFRGSFVTAHA